MIHHYRRPSHPFIIFGVIRPRRQHSREKPIRHAVPYPQFKKVPKRMKVPSITVMIGKNLVYPLPVISSSQPSWLLQTELPWKEAEAFHRLEMPRQLHWATCQCVVYCSAYYVKGKGREVSEVYMWYANLKRTVKIDYLHVGLPLKEEDVSERCRHKK